MPEKMSVRDCPSRHCWGTLHVHRHPHGAQVADTHYAADDISTQVVKNQHFPYRVSFIVKNGGNRGKETVGVGFIGFGGLDRLIEIEDLLERS